jgi:hypothetical protein
MDALNALIENEMPVDADDSVLAPPPEEKPKSRGRPPRVIKTKTTKPVEEPVEEKPLTTDEQMDIAWKYLYTQTDGLLGFVEKYKKMKSDAEAVRNELSRSAR